MFNHFSKTTQESNFKRFALIAGVKTIECTIYVHNNIQSLHIVANEGLENEFIYKFRGQNGLSELVNLIEIKYDGIEINKIFAKIVKKFLLIDLYKIAPNVKPVYKISKSDPDSTVFKNLAKDYGYTSLTKLPKYMCNETREIWENENCEEESLEF